MLLSVGIGIGIGAVSAVEPMVVDLRLAATDDDRDAIVARTVGGIVSYTRWPAGQGQQPDQDALHLCVSGDARHATRLRAAGANAGRAISVEPVAAGASTADCDILYLGGMPPQAWGRMVHGIRNRAVLSIAETDPDCRSGTMFCLELRGSGRGFLLNIDAIARSAVRIDPRVLRLAQTAGKLP